MKKRINIAVVSVLLAVALLLCVTLSVSKYIINKGQQGKLTSQNFYFSGSFLKADEVPTYQIYGNTVTFAVRNYIDSLRINATDIKYTVLTDLTDGVEVNPSQGNLTKEVPSSQDITLSYNFATDELQKEITVSVTATGDFTQTLNAKFIFINNDVLRYEITDQANRDYAELYIYTGNTESNVTINWDKTKLLIDETNDYVFGNVTDEDTSVTMNNITADTTVKIVFFKKDITQDYTCGITKFDDIINIPTN